MSTSDFSFPGPGLARGLSSIAVRTAGSGARRLVQTSDVERLLEGPRLQDTVDRLLHSQLATDAVDAFFDGPLFSRFVDGLLDSQALWSLVDRIVASPSVTDAISHQGVGFADQLMLELRTRSRWADDLVEQVAGRLLRRPPREDRPPRDDRPPPPS